MPKRVRRVAVAVALSVVAIFPIPPLLPGPVAPAAAQEEAADDGRPPTPVETAPAESRSLTEILTVPGSLEARARVEVAVEVEGRVAEVVFEEGAEVAEGDLLATLDTALARAQLARADADLEANRRALARAETLAERGAGTEEAVDEASAALARTRAEVQYRQTLLQKHRITAPFDGRVAFRRVDPGAYVSPGTPVVELVDADPIEVAFEVPAEHAGAVAPGHAVTVDLDGEPREARVVAIAPAADSGTRGLALRAEIPNGDGRLLPGRFVRVEVPLRTVDDAVVVPEQAILPGPASDAVFVVADGRAERRRVTTGLRQLGIVQIVDGLTAGETVVVAGQQKLRDGARVGPAAQGGAEGGAEGSEG